MQGRSGVESRFGLDFSVWGDATARGGAEDVIFGACATE